MDGAARCSCSDISTTHVYSYRVELDQGTVALTFPPLMFTPARLTCRLKLSLNGNLDPFSNYGLKQRESGLSQSDTTWHIHCLLSLAKTFLTWHELRHHHHHHHHHHHTWPFKSHRNHTKGTRNHTKGTESWGSILCQKLTMHGLFKLFETGLISLFYTIAIIQYYRLNR